MIRVFFPNQSQIDVKITIAASKAAKYYKSEILLFFLDQSQNSQIKKEKKKGNNKLHQLK